MPPVFGKRNEIEGKGGEYPFPLTQNREVPELLTGALGARGAGMA